MRVFGLTGKSGAGKSYAAAIFEKNGFYIVDGDVIAREITLSGSPVLGRLSERFGKDIVRDDGSLDRKLLAERAFSSEENRLALNEITHGEIDKVISEKLEEAEKEGYSFALIDAAALLESPSKKRCEKIIVVHAEKNVRLKRIMGRDGIDEKDALIRINAQKDDEYYLSSADYVIENNDEFLAEKVNKIINTVQSEV